MQNLKLLFALGETMRRYTTVLSSFMLALIIPQVTQADVFGWQEKALIQPEQGSVEVELNPTSPKSSIEVHDLVLFQRNGENWVRFSVPVMHALTGTTDLTLERKVLRTEKSKGAFGSSQHQLVRMSLCLGDKVYVEDLALKTHGKGGSPVRLGRDVLPRLGLVDASRSDTLKPDCKL
ncbi:RimK/LysX family protein [Pseudomonas sp. MPB23]|uniref:putative ATP-dependent zinc protease n=1 Tax=Pseudomonas sp. MPB23 TaxID=3388490 RepID=UPI0039854E13